MKKFTFPRLLKWILATGLFFLLLMTLMRICLYLFFDRHSHQFTDLIPSFILGLRFDLRITCVIMLGMLLLTTIPPINPFVSKFGRIFWSAILSVVVLVLVIMYAVDFGHYAYLKQRLNASVLNYLEDAAISREMLWQSYPVVWIVAGLIIGFILIMILLRYIFRRIDRSHSIASKKQRLAWSILLFLLFALGYFGRFNQYGLRWSNAFELGDDYKAQLALNPFESFFNTLQYRHTTYNKERDEAKLKNYLPLLADYFGLPAEDSINFKRFISPADSLKVKPNVVLVICESFSAYKSSMWGNPLKTTPYFDQMSREGVFFDQCFSPTYGTARGVWAIITGIPDVEIANTASRNPAAVDQHTIINDFKNYEKYYFIGGSASWANIRGVLNNNIEGLTIYEEEDFKAGRVDVWGVSDKNLLLESARMLGQKKQPFFSVIQTADNHRPYTIPEEDAAEFKRINFPQDSVLKYGFESNEEVNAFRYTDFCFQKFMEAVKKEAYYPNTIFVFVGDHGIAGNANALFPSAWTAQRLSSEHVPLLYYAPGYLKAQRISRTSSQIDVLPTLAGFCKIPYLNSTLGRDLMDSSFFSKDLAFIFDPDSRMMGVVSDSFFFRKSFLSANEEMVSIRNNSLPVDTSSRLHLRQLTEGIFEASKYLLLNNKKN